MIFYQQSATVDKGLRARDLPFARIDTAIGAVFTQVIMIAIVVTCAATLYVRHISVSDAAHAALALVPLTGSKLAGIAFGAGLLGAALIGALVVSLATAWAFGEAFAWRCSLNMKCVDAKSFYGLYAAMIVIAAGIVLIPHLPLIRITLWVEAFNAFVLPLVLGFLLVMANDRKILGARVNSRLGNTVAFGIGAGLRRPGPVVRHADDPRASCRLRLSRAIGERARTFGPDPGARRIPHPRARTARRTVLPVRSSVREDMRST